MKKVYFLLAAVVIAFAACNENSPSSGKKGSDEKAVINENYVAKPFTVNAQGGKIVFSQGNLKYNLVTKNWTFAERQYDVVGSGNIIAWKPEAIGSQGETIDLFSWGTGDNPLKLSFDNSDYLMFKDWGENKILNGGNEAKVWRSLTQDEFEYILFGRTGYAELFGLGNIDGFNGLILLPDNWVKPEGLEFKHDFYDDGGYFPSRPINSYTEETWKLMEASGAVFFPAAGTRTATTSYSQNVWNFGSLGTDARFWVSTGAFPYGSAFSVSESFDDINGGRHYWVRPDGNNRKNGYCVRLVKDAE